jgi:hypothetical protein
MSMRHLMALVAVSMLVAAAPAQANTEAAADIQPRVDHHLREVGALVQHFETFVAADCPRFATVEEWNAHAEREIERMLLLAAHVEQAWVEAKRTGDDDVRRSAKAPRRRLEDAVQIMDKLSTCAQDHGAAFAPGPVFRRIERDLPRRQAEIALPR